MDVLNVYLSDNIIDESVDMLLRMATHKSLPLGYQVIVVSEKEEELLVIYGSHEVNTDRFLDKNYHIVGFGKGKKETEKLLKYIIDDMLVNTGSISKDRFLTIKN